MTKTSNTPLEILNNYWGYDDFRENQAEAIQDILDGDKDILYIARTGAGKSLVYQLPSVILEGTVLVVSPLLSLMSDQVSSLKLKNIRAEAYNSNIGVRTKKNIELRLKNGEIDILYAAPETLLNKNFIKVLEDTNIELIVFDECHCISSYGNDFRPQYKSVKVILDMFNVPCVALTATADPDTEADIVKTLRLGERDFKFSEYKQYLDRPSIFYHSIRKKAAPKKQLVDVLKHYDKTDTGIIYCTTKKACDDIASFLYRQGYRARPYYSTMSKKDKNKVLNDWLDNDLEIVVATSAFGMGIDHPSVRYVICYNMPSTVEDLLQAIGRASRDGEPSDGYIFYDNDDFRLWKWLLEETTKDTLEHRLSKLDDVTSLLKSRKCLRKQIIEYLGQDYDKDNCNSCSNCTKVRVI